MMEKLWSLFLFIILKYFYHFLPGFRVIGNISNVLMNLFMISGSIFYPDWCCGAATNSQMMTGGLAVSLQYYPITNDLFLLDSLNVSSLDKDGS